VPTDPVRLELYSQLLDAVRECQTEAIRIEENPVEVPANLRDDESPPVPLDAINAMERVNEIVRRIELAAPGQVVRAAGDLSLEASQIIAYSLDRPARTHRQELRDLWTGLPGAPQMESEASSPREPPIGLPTLAMPSFALLATISGYLTRSSNKARRREARLVSRQCGKASGNVTRS
jgi:hypothetical protein